MQSNNNLAHTRWAAPATLATWVKTTQVGGTDLWNSPAITGVEVAGSHNDIRWGYFDATGHIGVWSG